MTEVIELNPDQAYLLLRARTAEKDRVRHSKEAWVGQVNRDIRRRDDCLAQAVALGVPSVQAYRFIYWKGKNDER